jgi:hypothetical protein
MSNSIEFEEITGGGNFAKFDNVGDKVRGLFVSGSPTSETDFDGNPCPGIIVEDAQQLTTITCSQASIRRKATTAYAMNKLVPGALVEVELVGHYETKTGTKGKDFALRVAPPALVEIDDEGF